MTKLPINQTVSKHEQLKLTEHTTCSEKECYLTCVCSCGKCHKHYDKGDFIPWVTERRLRSA